MSLLRALIAVMLILWLLGVGFHIAGSLMHLLLVVALVVLIDDLLGGRRRTA